VQAAQPASGPGSDPSNGNNDDRLSGGPGDDEIAGLGGNDSVEGGPGDDTLIGMGGDDGVAGGPGADTAFGGPGVDTIAGGRDGDVLFGNFGSDVISGGEGDDFIDGDNPPSRLLLRCRRSSSAVTTTTALAGRERTRSSTARTLRPSSDGRDGTTEHDAGGVRAYGLPQLTSVTSEATAFTARPPIRATGTEARPRRRSPRRLQLDHRPGEGGRGPRPSRPVTPTTATRVA
jgi:Ca2+-binding RTX toxin-like protein